MGRRSRRRRAPGTCRRSRGRRSASRCPSRRRSGTAGSRRRSSRAASRRRRAAPRSRRSRPRGTTRPRPSSTARRAGRRGRRSRANSAAVIACAAYSAVTLSAAVWRRNTGHAVGGIGLVRGEAAVGLDHGVVRAAIAVRAGRAEPGERHVDDVGVDRANVVVAEPELGPSRRAGSSGSSTSASAASRRTMSTPSGVWRSTAIDRFPRLQTRNSELMPLTDTPTQRAMSPMPGRSTLITVAPWSASSAAAYGPGERDRQVEDADAVHGRQPSSTPAASPLTRVELRVHARPAVGTAVREAVAAAGPRTRAATTAARAASHASISASSAA